MYHGERLNAWTHLIGTLLSISGASILIIVGVGLETVKQIESQLKQHHYEGFLR